MSASVDSSFSMQKEHLEAAKRRISALFKDAQAGFLPEYILPSEAPTDPATNTLIVQPMRVIKNTGAELRRIKNSPSAAVALSDGRAPAGNIGLDGERALKMVAKLNALAVWWLARREQFVKDGSTAEIPEQPPTSIVELADAAPAPVPEPAEPVPILAGAP